MGRGDALYGSRWRATLWFGIPAGLLMGGISYAVTGAATAGISEGVLGVVIFVPLMRRLSRRLWPGSRTLEAADRVAVVGAVRQGGPVDARLAPAVLDYVAAVRRAHDRDRRYRWVLPLVALGTLSLAVSAAVGDSARSAVAWSVVVIFWIVFLASMPRRQRRILAHAAEAEAAAYRALHSS